MNLSISWIQLERASESWLLFQCLNSVSVTSLEWSLSRHFQDERQRAKGRNIEIEIRPVPQASLKSALLAISRILPLAFYLSAYGTWAHGTCTGALNCR